MHSPVTGSRIAWVKPGPHAALHASTLSTFGYIHFTPGAPGLPLSLESYYNSIPEFYFYYSHASLAITLGLCSFHN